jgi:hypothetical protein
MNIITSRPRVHTARCPHGVYLRRYLRRAEQPSRMLPYLTLPPSRYYPMGHVTTIPPLSENQPHTRSSSPLISPRCTPTANGQTFNMPCLGT